MIRNTWMIGVQLLFAPCIFAQKEYQLAPPLAKYESVFFEKNTTIRFTFDQPGSNIRFTTNGSEPGTASPVYEKPIAIKKNSTLIKARSFGDGFLPSETISIHFFSVGKAIANINTSAPNPKYAGNGASTLTDNRSGGTNQVNPGWLGFDSDSVVFDITLKKREGISQVMLHVLNNQGAWIFLPCKVNVYVMDDNKPRLLRSQAFELTRESKTEEKAILLDIPATKAKQFRMVVYPLAVLPDWHPGKGNKAWLFIDELKLY